ncbi:insecticidal delta-endotoxin Cry8Ea1 family protein [Bacillus thuringiensis]|uniref:insecticidal delta-endotoxin Cry8Ea1 family protein n=1 Tax=Bacillus thuringiensis TaxID=1428 RepID=UPI00333D77AF
MQNALELYQEAADAWNQEPNNEAYKERVRRQFTATNTVIEQRMPSFRVLGFEVPLLVVFAQAANLHLQLLRDAVKFGEGWDLPSIEIENLYTRLTNRTREYTDHCVNTYDEGLKQARALKGNPKDYTRYPYLDPYSKDPTYGKYYNAPVDWNLFNDFRRDMILMVLDLVAVWPTYNPRVYPNPYGVQIQLSREIYSTVYGRGWVDNSSVDAIESTLVRPPHLVTELTNLKFTQRDPMQGESWYAKFGTVTNTLRYIGSSNTWEESFSAIGLGAMRPVQNVPTTNIGNLSLALSEVPVGFAFYDGYDGFITGVGESSYATWWNGIPKASDSNENSHHLSYVAALGSNNTAGWWPYTYPNPLLGEWGFGWLHNSLKPENTILSDKTTQIPAVKGNGVEFGATVVRGPGSTGGDLVGLPAYNGGWTQLRVVVKPSTTARTRGYNVRIRYASEGNANLFVGKYVVNRWYETGNYNVDRTFSGGMTYNAFKYLDAISFAANEEEFKIELRCNSGGPIYIDKIEFIPVNPIEEPPVTEGTYQIVTALNNSSVLDMETPSLAPNLYRVALWQNGGGYNQKWNFVYDSSQDAYQIKVLSPNYLSLSWQGDSINVYVDHQAVFPIRHYWKVENAGNGYVYLRAKQDPNKVMAVSNGSSANGTGIIVQDYQGSASQKFKLVRLD